MYAYAARSLFRHAVYKTQYRAMFVENCRVNAAEVVYMPSADPSARRLGKRKHKNKRNEETAMEASPSSTSVDAPLQANARFAVGTAPSTLAVDDLFAPVECAVCATEVGVMDRDEVYHFFNVLSSYT